MLYIRVSAAAMVTQTGSGMPSFQSGRSVAHDEYHSKARGARLKLPREHSDPWWERLRPLLRWHRHSNTSSPGGRSHLEGPTSSLKPASEPPFPFWTHRLLMAPSRVGKQTVVSQCSCRSRWVMWVRVALCGECVWVSVSSCLHSYWKWHLAAVSQLKSISFHTCIDALKAMWAWPTLLQEKSQGMGFFCGFFCFQD